MENFTQGMHNCVQKVTKTTTTSSLVQTNTIPPPDLKTSFNAHPRAMRSWHSLLLIFGFLMAFQAPVYGQFCSNDPIPFDQMDLRNSYDLMQTGTSGDAQVIGARLVTDICNTCTPGEVITANLIIQIDHNTQSGGRTLGIFSDLIVTGSDGSVSTCDIVRCSGPLLRNSDEPFITANGETYQEVDYGEITFTCGDSLVLSDILIVWTPANGDCPVPVHASKWSTTTPDIDIVPPFYAAATAECGSGNSTNINLTVSGGSGDFSYDWDNDGTGDFDDSMNLSNVPLGTYTVVVRDNDSDDGTGSLCTVTTTVEFNGPCCQPPTIICPQDATVQCDESTDPADTGTATSTEGCGTVSISFSDSSVAGCGNTETITRTWTATDENGDSDVCIQTITSVDTTAPVLSGQGADGDVECPGALVFTAPTAADDCDNASVITFTDATTTDNCGLDSVTRTWIATDCSGNASAPVSQTLTSVDTTAPVLSGQGADGVVECPGALVFTAPTAADDCDNASVITFTDATTTDNCGLDSVTRTWIATDCSNNASAPVSQTLTSVDTTAPVLSGQGADGDVECPGALVFTAPTAADDCDNASVITFTDATTTDNCGLDSVTRTWIATDCSNNASAPVSQTLTSVDTTAPVLSGQGADGDVECPGDLVFTAPTAADDCDNASVITFTDATTTDNCGLDSVTRTWIATDCSNNASAPVSQTLTSVDTTAPVLSGQGADGDVECPGDLVFTAPTAADDCDNASAIAFTDATTTDNCGLDSVTRTWIATDCSNNASAPVSQTLTSVDTTAPVLSGQGADGDVECPGALVFTAPTAADDCDNASVITFTDATTTDNCGLDSVTRTWIATDCSNNASAPVSQTLTSVDTTAPVLSGQGADGDVECPGALVFTAPTAADDCDNASVITFTDATTTDNCGLDSVTRTWIATDCSNNASAPVSQTLTSVDTTAPVLSGQGADGDVECPGDLVFTAPTAADDCDNASAIAFTDATTTDNCGLDSVTRTWIATDCSGNASAPVSQTLTSVDTTAPVLSGQGADGDVECPGALVFTAPTAADDCDNASAIAFTDATTTDNCGLDSVTRTWIATDCSGNASAPVSQTLTSVDTTAPVLSGQGADGDVECPGALVFTAPTAADDCDNASAIAFTDATTTDNCGLDSVTRTWIATDCSGNASAPVSQTLTSVDTTAPVLSGQGADGDVECPGDLVFTAPTAADDCDNASAIAFTDATTTDNCGLDSVTRTWIATDCSGKVSAPVSQTLTSVDTTAPVLSGQGASGNVECPGALEFTAPTAADDCDSASVISFTDATTTDNCGLDSVTRTWIATDCSGKVSAPVSQTLTSVDTTAPVLSGQGASGNVECPGALEFTAPTAADDCDSASVISFTDATTTDNCGLDSVTRTWIATDCSGKVSAPVSQTLTSVDTTAPTITCPPDVTVECGQSTDPDNTDSATGSDTCGSVTITYADSSVAGCGNTEVITRTWTATDDCGNTASCDQTITVVDTTAPVIVCAPDIIADPIQCGDSLDPANTGITTATDACDNDVSYDGGGITFSDERFDDCEEGYYEIHRTWTATDDCGNSASCLQVIRVKTVIEGDCFNIQLADVSTDGSSTTYQWQVCGNGGSSRCRALSNIVFEMPCGMIADAPEDGGPYSGEFANYLVENPNRDAQIQGGQPVCRKFYGIKFNTIGEGIKNEGECEVFVYTLPGDYTDPNDPLFGFDPRVEIKAGKKTTTSDPISVEGCECEFDPIAPSNQAPQQDTPQFDGPMLSIYPNPARINFNIKLEGYSSEFAEIVMFDVSGRQILNVRKRVIPNKDMTIDLPISIDDGLYYVRLKNNRSVKSVPVIISRMD